MLQNYFKTAIRSLLKNRLYSAINILGLAVGLAAVLIILLYLQVQLNFDRFHTLKDRLYRISVVMHRQDVQELDSPVFVPPIGPAMKEAFPEVENYTRISTKQSAYFAYTDKSLKIEETCFADSTFFDLFSFDLVAGNPQSALSAPYTAVLTEGIAKRIFGNENPIGKTIRLNQQEEYQITGLVKDPPAYSHIQFEALLSFSSLYQNKNLYLDWDGGNQYITYVLLNKYDRAASIEKKFPGFMWRHINEKIAPYGVRLAPYLQPLKDIHLHYNEYSKNLRTNLYVFGAVGLLILFIACVNFINLTTARATWRSKEVGVRKVVGASRRNLVVQFIGESLLVSILAMLLALVLVKLLEPALDNLLEEQVRVMAAFNWATVLSLGAVLLVVGIVAGSYPAFYLSAQEAIQSLNRNQIGQKRQLLRNSLVVLQFSISITLIISTLVINRQLNYTKQKSLGFDKENILVLPLTGEEAQDKFLTLQQEFKKLPRVLSVTGSSEVPGAGFTSNGYVPEGMEQSMMINVVDIDKAFLQTYDIDIIQGVGFDNNQMIEEEGYLINETLARTLGWNDPLNKTISRNGKHLVIGLVKDFHFADLHNEITPLILTNKPWQKRFSYLSIKVAPGSLSNWMASVEKVWKSVLPQLPMEAWFLDDSLNQMYQSERRFQALFFYCALLSILIAVMGILGLVTFAMEQRSKEIGIRKVLGASVTDIIELLSKDFIRLVIIAALLSFPIAWWAMNRWLDDFAYRIQISWWMFVLGGLAALTIALITVAAQAIRAAVVNPVERLKRE